MRIALLAVLVLACSDPSAAPAPIHIASASPPHAPLRGGTRIELTGSGFEADARVLVGGREAPLVTAVDATTLQLVIPPGEQPGDAELVVFDRDGSTSMRGVFRYSEPPTIDAVSPAKVLVTAPTTLVTLEGSGFLDEGAGAVEILVDGVLASGVRVESDTRLVFALPPGPALVEPTIEVIDARGTATRPRAFRYVPSERPGLLLFPAFGDHFAIFYDPSDGSTVRLPWIAGPATRFTSVVRDEHDDYWAVDRAGQFGRLDMRTQRIAEPVTAGGLYPTLARAGLDTFALERSQLVFARVDLATAAFTRLGTAQLPCCGSFGLAADGETLYFTSRNGPTVSLATLDRSTGEVGTPLALVASPGFHVEEMRFFDGTLYAASRDGTLTTIDRTTGMVTVLPLPADLSARFTAIERLD